MNWRCWTITGKFQRLAKHPWQPKCGSTLRHVSIKNQPQQSNGLHALIKPPDQITLSVRLNIMSSRTSSRANWKFSSTFPHNWINCAGKAFSYLQCHDIVSSFHAADLIHNQFIQIVMLEIYFLTCSLESQPGKPNWIFCHYYWAVRDFALYLYWSES